MKTTLGIEITRTPTTRAKNNCNDNSSNNSCYCNIGRRVSEQPSVTQAAPKVARYRNDQVPRKPENSIARIKLFSFPGTGHKILK